MTEILEKLNTEQRESVVYNDGALLVLAGAGTGKTRVLTSKIAYLLEMGQAHPSEILAVTFTNKASNEMKNRVVSFVKKDISPIWLGTFHSIGNKILSRHAELVGLTSNFTIIDIDDQNRILKQILIDLDIDTKDFPVKNYLNKINEWKDKGISYDKVSNFTFDKNYIPEISNIYKIYQERCKKIDICDFGDLLLYCVEIFKSNPDILKTYVDKFQYILVDEYQDTNLIQNVWLKLICGLGIKKKIKITCVGDDDQSIYGWRGAEIKNILKFEKDFDNTKIVRLERNYRSTSNILKVASSVILNNNNRHQKTLWTDEKNQGEKVSLSCYNRDKEEVFSIAKNILELNKNIEYKDIAILVRAGYQTRIFEEIFISQTIPYKIVGGFKFYDRKEIKDCIAYLKLIKNHSDYLSFERIINVPKRGIGNVTLSKILEEVKGQKINILDVAEDLCLNGIIKGKTAKNIMEFTTNIREWSRQLGEKDHITLTKEIVIGSGYISSLLADKTNDSKNAIENINEFIRGLVDFSDISEFLEYISLVNDKPNTKEDNSVNLMTIHSAKGLEFDSVFLPSWEEGIFPSPRSVDTNLEEERRLAYVAITRAKNNLFISYSKMRYEYGEIRSMKPSRFIKELPEDNLQINGNMSSFEDEEEIYANEEIEYSESRVNKYNNYYTPKKNFKKENDENLILSMKNITKRVSHPTFGIGFVVKTEGNKVTIAFKEAGIKTIISDFIKIID